MNATSQYDLTIVIPVYNSEETLPVLLGELERYKEKSPHKVCVLFVNDASTDHSLDLIRDYCMRVQGAYFLSLVKRSGLTACIKAGLLRTSSPYFGFTDASLRSNVEDFDQMYDQCHDAGLVCGQRDFSASPRFSHLVARFFNFCRRQITHDDLYDGGFPMKLANTALIKRMPWFSGMHYLMPGLIKLTGSRVVAVTVRTRQGARASRRSSMLSTALTGICDLMVFVWMRCRYIDPAVYEGNLEDDEQ